MADDVFEYTNSGAYPVWLNVQAADGSTATADPGGTVLVAEPVDAAGLVPANDAARSAADLLAQADAGGPLAERVGDLKVGEVLPLLDVLDPVELAQVRDAESAGGARKTVLARIDELLPSDDDEEAPSASEGEEV